MRATSISGAIPIQYMQMPPRRSTSGVPDRALEAGGIGLQPPSDGLYVPGMQPRSSGVSIHSGHSPGFVAGRSGVVTTGGIVVVTASGLRPSSAGLVLVCRYISCDSVDPPVRRPTVGSARYRAATDATDATARLSAPSTRARPWDTGMSRS